AAAQISADDQCALIIWPDAIAVDKREPGPPGLPDGLTGARIRPDRRAEPGEKMRSACHLVLAAVWGRCTPPLRPDPAGCRPVCRGPARLRQVAREPAIDDEMQARLQFVLGQLRSVPALQDCQSWLGHNEVKRIVIGEPLLTD